MCTTCVPGVCGFPYHRTVAGVTWLLGTPLSPMVAVLTSSSSWLLCPFSSACLLCCCLWSPSCFIHPPTCESAFVCLFALFASQYSLQRDLSHRQIPTECPELWTLPRNSYCMLDLINNLSYCVIPFDCSLLISVLRFDIIYQRRFCWSFWCQSEENKQVESMWGVPMATPTSGSRTEHQAVRYLLKIILSPKLIIVTSDEGQRAP